MSKSKKEITVSSIIGLFIGAALIYALRILLIQLGWNLFASEVFGLRSITLLESFGFSLLAGAFSGVSGK